MDTRTAPGAPHPDWCDPRDHVDYTAADADHRAAPDSLDVDGIRITVGRCQFVNTGTGETAPVETRLALDDGDTVVAATLPDLGLDALIALLIAYRRRS